jgi:hypothetical protein
MPDRIRIIPHEAVPLCGSYEVRFSDGRPSRYFYWDDIPGSRLRADVVDGDGRSWRHTRLATKSGATMELPRNPVKRSAPSLAEQMRELEELRRLVRIAEAKRSNGSKAPAYSPEFV